MNAHRRTWLVAGLVMIGVGFLLVGGAAKSAADSTGDVCGTGTKPLCINVTGDPDPQ